MALASFLIPLESKALVSMNNIDLGGVYDTDTRGDILSSLEKVYGKLVWVYGELEGHLYMEIPEKYEF